MFLFTNLCIAIIPFLVLGSNLLQYRQVCGDTYKVCAPVGATNSQLPSVGPDLGKLYTELVQAVASEGTADLKPAVDVIIPVKRQTEKALCCAQTSQCLLLPAYNIAFCWDLYTTDFYFPDNSYGSLTWGNLTSADGTRINLIYGNWENPDGSKGNIYSDASSMMPNTSTMSMPTPFTSSGVGSAIPASELGSMTIMNASTTHTSESTISAITLISTTISIGTSRCRHCNNTIIPGLTGLPPTVTTVVNNTGFPVTTITRNGTSTIGIVPATIINNAVSLTLISCRSAVALIITSIIMYTIMVV